MSLRCRDFLRPSRKRRPRKDTPRKGRPAELGSVTVPSGIRHASEEGFLGQKGPLERPLHQTGTPQSWPWDAQHFPVRQDQFQHHTAASSPTDPSSAFPGLSFPTRPLPASKHPTFRRLCPLTAAWADFQELLPNHEHRIW